MEIIVPLVEGFEEIEAVTIVDVLRRASLEVITVYLNDNPVKGSHEIAVKADKYIDEVAQKKFQAVILPGGMPGSRHLMLDERIIKLLQKADNEGAYIAAICAAPIVLAKAGLLNGKKITAFPGYDEYLAGAQQTGEPVTVDDRIITGKGAGCAIPFALKLVEILKDKKTADLLKEKMQV